MILPAVDAMGKPVLQADPINPFDQVITSFIQLFFPIWFAYLMIMFAFRIGVKKKRDKCDPSCPLIPFKSCRCTPAFLNWVSCSKRLSRALEDSGMLAASWAFTVLPCK